MNFDYNKTGSSKSLMKDEDTPLAIPSWAIFFFLPFLRNYWLTVDMIGSLQVVIYKLQIEGKKYLFWMSVDFFKSASCIFVDTQFMLQVLTFTIQVIGKKLLPWLALLHSTKLQTT
jgi:hypothetical protein